MKWIELKRSLILQKKCLVNVQNELNIAKEEIKSLRKTPKADIKKPDKKDHKASSIKCDLCDKVFSRNSELEAHLERVHNEEKKFKCHECEMTFMLKWRLGKHVSIHTEKDGLLKFCHYFNNDKTCPYANIGCMFLHKNAPTCHFKENCSKK